MQCNCTGPTQVCNMCHAEKVMLFRSKENKVKTKTRKKQSRVGLKSNRVDWSGIENLDCLTLIDHGMHAATISKATGMSVGQVQYRAKLAGQRLRDYRDGCGPVGTVLFTKFKVSTMGKETKNAIKLVTKARAEKLTKIQSAQKKRKLKRKS